MNFAKIFSIVILIIFSTIVNCEVNESGFADKESTEKIFMQMGLHEKTEITRKEIEVLFYRMITKDKEDKQHKSFYESVSKKLAQKVPAKIATKDVPSYFDDVNIMQAIEEVITEQYGAEYVPQIREAFKSALGNSEQGTKGKKTSKRASSTKTDKKPETSSNKESESAESSTTTQNESEQEKENTREDTTTNNSSQEETQAEDSSAHSTSEEVNTESNETAQTSENIPTDDL